MTKWWGWLCKHCGVTIQWEDYEWVDAYGKTTCKKSPDGLHDVEATT